MIREAIAKLVEHKDLTEEEASVVAREILSNEATPSQMAAFLTALRMKGEKVDELVGMAKAMRECSLRINPKVPQDKLIDTCGTGGDRSETFNVSTVAAIIAAGAGAYVAKHGNRSVSSKSGSADVLEVLGVNILASPEVVERCIERVGIGFMFAPSFHPAMKHVAGPRKEIGIRTVFNMLGPLTNPAGVRAQLLGVFNEQVMDLMAMSLKRLGAIRALIVHGSGIDEVTVSGPTKILELTEEGINSYSVKPGDFGLKGYDLTELKVSSISEAAEKVFRLLYSPKDVPEPVKEFALANAAAALKIAGLIERLDEGVELAEESLSSGAAYNKLKLLVKESGGDISKLEVLEEKYG